jgi:hypothetical protein
MKNLTRLTLRLGRNPDAGFPEGDTQYGYVVVAPLGRDGKLDPKLWAQHKADCTVLRFSPDDEERADGWLSHRGSHWYFRYDEVDEGPDEDLFKLGDHRLFVGDYLTVHDPDGGALVYRVTEAVEV